MKFLPTFNVERRIYMWRTNRKDGWWMDFRHRWIGDKGFGDICPFDLICFLNDLHNGSCGGCWYDHCPQNPNRPW